MEQTEGENIKNESASDQVGGEAGSPKKESHQEKKDDTAEVILGVLFLAAIIYGIWSWLATDDELYTPKDQLKSELSIMISNGADLDSVKHHYNSVTYEEWGLFYGWNNEKKDHYRNDISLLAVMKDIKNDGYLKASEYNLDPNVVSNLINEYQQRNPFDGLEAIQKDQFNNIRLKLGEHYDLVSGEINKLSDELLQKNKLVTQYLADSKTSLYISIASLVFALLMAIITPFIQRTVTSNKQNQSDT